MRREGRRKSEIVAKQRAATPTLYESVYMQSIELIKLLLGHDADRDKPRIIPPGKGATSPFEVAKREMVQESLKRRVAWWVFSMSPALGLCLALHMKTQYLYVDRGLHILCLKSCLHHPGEQCSLRGEFAFKIIDCQSEGISCQCMVE